MKITCAGGSILLELASSWTGQLGPRTVRRQDKADAVNTRVTFVGGRKVRHQNGADAVNTRVIFVASQFEACHAPSSKFMLDPSGWAHSQSLDAKLVV
jgi:hypothetical protein